jgi:hypothetical protein
LWFKRKAKDIWLLPLPNDITVIVKLVLIAVEFGVEVFVEWIVFDFASFGWERRRRIDLPQDSRAFDESNSRQMR